MPEGRYLSRWFLGVGIGLAMVGAVIWFLTPVRPMLPPYVVTAVLAIGYGVHCRRQADPPRP